VCVMLSFPSATSSETDNFSDRTQKVFSALIDLRVYIVPSDPRGRVQIFIANSRHILSAGRSKLEDFGIGFLFWTSRGVTSSRFLFSPSGKNLNHFNRKIENCQSKMVCSPKQVKSIDNNFLKPGAIRSPWMISYQIP